MMLDKPLTMIGILELEKRSKKVIESFGIGDLMEYTIDSCGGCDLVDFYRSVIEAILIEEVAVSAEEISDGKYEIIFEFEDKDIGYISSYAWDTVDMVIENLMDNIIIPHIRQEEKQWQSQHTA